MLTDIDTLSLEYICLNMREGDRKEVFALMEHSDPLRLAHEAAHMIRNKGRGRIAWHKGRPAALMAFTEMRPGVWEVWMFGTDDFRACVFALMRWCRKEANDILTVCNGHRLQCHSMAGYTEAHKLIMGMGGKPEGEPLRKYGKGGEDFQTFVWLNGENDAVLKPHYRQAS